MDGIALWGAPAVGAPLIRAPDEPVFPEPWQGSAFALALLSNRLAGGILCTGLR
jgi:nitrile hydratase subunit beta